MKIKIFDYRQDIEAFTVTKHYNAMACDLGLSEWNPVVWIGRLFCMDNDYGEHWFDNWELRERVRRKIALEHIPIDIDDEEILIIDPERFQDGHDGPCHTNEMRRWFWTNVLDSLYLDSELLFAKAIERNEHMKNTNDLQDGYIPDLMKRIEQWRRTHTSQNADSDDMFSSHE